MTPSEEARAWLRGSELDQARRAWDKQIDMNRSADWRSAHMIASKMQRCANNPRNGGTGRGESPYYVDDEDSRRQAADNREGGMKRRWR